MPFIKLPGVVGKVYAPDEPVDHPKKHACSQCYYCQMCCDARCEVCRAEHASAAPPTPSKDNTGKSPAHRCQIRSLPVARKG